MIGKSPFTVQMQTSATADVMYLQLRPASSRHISSKRGQFIYLQMNLLGEEHPFSAMQYDAKTGDITVAYKKFGPFTEKLSHLEAGDTVYIDGPYGVFTEQITPGYNYPVVMIAGGIGITPFVDHVLNGSSTDQWLFYANQTKASSAFINTLEMKLGNRLVPIYSGEQRPDGETGFIRAELFSKYLQNPTRYHYFVCGPPRMMEATKTALIGLGVSAEQIHSEDFSF
jgi:predicted ferric reductase